MGGHPHGAVTHVEGDITGVENVVGAVLLNHLSPVSITNDEVMDSVMAIDLQDVPQAWFATGFHHRFLARIGLLRDLSPQVTSKNHCLQSCCAVPSGTGITPSVCRPLPPRKAWLVRFLPGV